jgi:oligopeptide/dipeptide ABC transporter ATP-binding protein
MTLTRTTLFSVLFVATLGTTSFSTTHAATLKWTSQGEIPTWDPHSQNNVLSNGIHASVYESLVYYNKKFELEGILATAWKQVTPLNVRFTLRKGVKFHDGSAFTADDVVFTFDRAMSKTSNFGAFTQGIDRVVTVDEHTIDIFTKTPNPVLLPVLLRQLTEVRMMNKAWATKNNSITPKDIKIKDENYAHRNAMGTGPFMLKSWEQDVKLMLTQNPNWWGKLEGNLTEVVYTPIKADATRVAALLGGEVDLVLDPAPQDQPRLRSNTNISVIDGAENRTIFLGMDQFREELTGSNVKGKNPLKDQRVRQALYQAIDIQAIHKVTMRGLSQVTGSIVAPQVNGWSKKADERYPYSLDASKKRLAAAGYPAGLPASTCWAGAYRRLTRYTACSLGITVLFISHNLQVVHYVADRIGVMYLGQLVEIAPKAELFASPKHTYTRMLLDAIPDMAMSGKARTPVAGEVPNPLNPPSGCAFHPRCPQAADRCKQEAPPSRTVGASVVACHWAD